MYDYYNIVICYSCIFNDIVSIYVRIENPFIAKAKIVLRRKGSFLGPEFYTTAQNSIYSYFIVTTENGALEVQLLTSHSLVEQQLVYSASITEPNKAVRRSPSFP